MLFRSRSRVDMVACHGHVCVQSGDDDDDDADGIILGCASVPRGIAEMIDRNERNCVSASPRC